MYIKWGCFGTYSKTSNFFQQGTEHKILNGSYYTHKKAILPLCNFRIFSTVRLIKNVIQSTCYTNYANKEEDIHFYLCGIHKALYTDTHACTTNN